MTSLERHTPQEWRQIRGYTQLQLAIRAQLTPTTISDYETGQYAPNAENWQRIAVALSTEDEQLLMDQIEWPALMQEKPASYRKSTQRSDRPKTYAA